MRGKDPQRNPVSGIRDLECKEQAVDPLPESRRVLNGAANSRRIGALPPGELEARPVHDQFGALPIGEQ